MPSHAERNAEGLLFDMNTHRWISQNSWQSRYPGHIIGHQSLVDENITTEVSDFITRSLSSPPSQSETEDSEHLVDCEYCGEDSLDEDEQYRVEDIILCESCFDASTYVCSNCDEPYLNENLIEVTYSIRHYGTTSICKDCIDQISDEQIQFDKFAGNYIIYDEDESQNTKTVIIYKPSDREWNWINIKHDENTEDVKIYLRRIGHYRDNIGVYLANFKLPNRVNGVEVDTQLTPAQISSVTSLLRRQTTEENNLPTVRMPESRCLNIHKTTEEEMNQGNGVYCVNCIKTPLMQRLEQSGEYDTPSYLTERAKFIDQLETSLTVQKIKPDNYHAALHDNFKNRKYRLPDERPYLYYGAEIEIDLPQGRNRVVFAETICMVSEGLFVAERDASIPNGVEFITRPMSYKAWTSEKVVKLLDKVFDIMDKWGVNTIDQRNSGLHIHMSKKFFNNSKTKTTDQQLQDLAWIFEFYNKEISQFSRRELNEFCQTREYKVKQQLSKRSDFRNIKMKIQLEKDGLIKSAGSGDSHHHIIAETHETVEIRSFKTVTDTNTLLAAVEFSRNIAHYVRNYTTKGRNLQQILSAKDSPHLDRYMKQQKLNFSDSTIIKDYIDIELNNNKEREDF